MGLYAPKSVVDVTLPTAIVTRTSVARARTRTVGERNGADRVTVVLGSPTLFDFTPVGHSGSPRVPRTSATLRSSLGMRRCSLQIYRLS
ncbi:hypothetical protein [Haladaptatus sp. R4]|uniref:hypothetical protein n=1 Tax=Haladaptatus sp. R4 TaxID=1679489 RepID=UPI001CBEDAC3|nr:hypothetical protein [Haladaptatus sp. R4]